MTENHHNENNSGPQPVSYGVKKKFSDIIHTAGESYSLSDADKARMSYVLREYMAHKPLPQQALRASKRSHWWMLYVHRPIALSLVFVLIFGGSASFAAENALPGELLYPMKTKVNEPVRVALATDSQAAARVHIELAERRIEEATTLASEGKLDGDIEEELASAFESHAGSANANIEETKTTDDTSASELASRFENRLAAYESVLAEVEIEEEGVVKTRRLAEAIHVTNAALAEARYSRSGSLSDEGVIIASAVASDSANTRTMSMSSEIDAPSDEPVATLTMALATTEEATNSPSLKSSATPEMTMRVPEEKTVSRMKEAAEKSLEAARKAFRSARSLSKEARDRAQNDIDVASTLVRDGKRALEDEDLSSAYLSFEDATRVSDQAIVYIKAAPALEKARARSNKETNQSGEVQGAETQDEDTSKTNGSSSTVSNTPQVKSDEDTKDEKPQKPEDDKKSEDEDKKNDEDSSSSNDSSDSNDD